MKVFISWSGSRSKLLGNKLRAWLPLVLQNVHPYMSNDDIPTGARWLHSISSELESSDFGVLCLTPENLRAPWINFEAGALSKKVDNSRVVPMLFDLQKRDIKAPLDQFQAAVFDRDGVQSLLKSINNAAVTEGRTESDLYKAFTALWPEFEAVFRTIGPNIHLINVDITFSLNDPQRQEVDLPTQRLCRVTKWFDGYCRRKVVRIPSRTGDAEAVCL